MYLPILLFSALCSLAHGLPKNQATPAGASASPDMTIEVSDFHAWTTAADSLGDNWATFLAYDEEYTYGAICSIRSDKSLYLIDSWYPCEMRKNATEMAMAFQLLDGMSEVEIRKGWDSNGMYLTGYAKQRTYWNEAYGGNVTTMANGTYYNQTEPWTFEITRIVG